MSDILFMELYDDVFSSNISVTKNNDLKIHVDTSKEDILFNKLKAEYLKIINIKDYESIQNNLYKGKNKKEIIEFEIVRILSNNNVAAIVSEQIVNVEKLLKMFDDDISNELYCKLVNLIIKWELSLGIKIGLFRELCFLYEKETKKFTIEEYIK